MDICIIVGAVSAFSAFFGFVVGICVGDLVNRKAKERARIIGSAGRIRVTRIHDGGYSQRSVPGGV